MKVFDILITETFIIFFGFGTFTIICTVSFQFLGGSIYFWRGVHLVIWLL